MLLTDWIYNTLATNEKRGFMSLKFRLATYLRNFFLKFSDPFVNYKIGSSVIKMSLSHQLGLYRKSYTQYSTNPARIAELIKEKYADLTFLDIGSNIGDSIPFLREKSFFPILAIEGEEEFYSILEKNTSNLEDVQVCKAFIGEKKESSMRSFVKVGGTAHSLTAQDGKEVCTETLEDILDKFPVFKKSKMIKIDTDGFDCKIIRGARDYLSKVQPIIFFEYFPDLLEKQNDDGISVFDTLFEWGYTKMLVYNNLGTFLYSINLDDKVHVQEMHSYFSGNYYCDIPSPK
jgi:FkbM family methyltransferase